MSRRIKIIRVYRSLLVVAGVLASQSCSSGGRVFTGEPTEETPGSAGGGAAGAGVGNAGDENGGALSAGGSPEPEALPNGEAGTATGGDGDGGDVDVDHCQEEPCQNGGTCSDGVDTFTCSCPKGFSGTVCERVATSCSDEPCQNGATCANTADGYACTCLTGFDGSNCEVNKNDCTAGLCQHGAACVDGVNDFTCQCEPGYSGKTCATNIDDCKPNVCKNGGTCVDGVSSYTCECDSRHTGPACEFLEVKVVPADLYLGDETRATALSNDGSVALLDVAGGDYVARIVDFESVGEVDLANLKSSGRWGRGISGDGAVIAGEALLGESYLPFRVAGTSAQPLDLSPLAPEFGSALDVSADGNTIVGDMYDTATGLLQAFRHTAAGGELVGDWLAQDGTHEANAVSGDGSVIAGTARGLDALPARAWLWTKSTGASVTLALGGGTWSRPQVRDISRDGNTVVGFVNINGISHLVRWRASSWAPEDLGTGAAFGTNKDGSVVVGADNSGNAIVWTSSGGKQTLASILGSNPDLAGLDLFEAIGVSDDGKVVAGTADSSGTLRAFMAHLP